MPEDEDEEDDDERELPSEPMTEDDEGDGGMAPAPAPPDTDDLSQSLRFALDVYEDCMVVTEGWLERARYGLGEAPMEWRAES